MLNRLRRMQSEKGDQMSDLPQKVYDAIDQLNEAIIAAEKAGYSCSIRPEMIECPRPERPENMAAKLFVRVFMEIPSVKGGVN